MNAVFDFFLFFFMHYYCECTSFNWLIHAKFISSTFSLVKLERGTTRDIIGFFCFAPWSGDEQNSSNESMCYHTHCISLLMPPSSRMKVTSNAGLWHIFKTCFQFKTRNWASCVYAAPCWFLNIPHAMSRLLVSHLQ